MNIPITKCLFWIGFSICTYVYLVYPIVLFFQSIINKNRKIDYLNKTLPKVTIFIPCYNEETVILNKIEQCLFLKLSY